MFKCFVKQTLTEKNHVFALISELSIMSSETWIIVSKGDSWWLTESMMRGLRIVKKKFVFKSKETTQRGNLFFYHCELGSLLVHQQLPKCCWMLPQECSCSLELRLFLIRARMNYFWSFYQTCWETHVNSTLSFKGEITFSLLLSTKWPHTENNRITTLTLQRGRESALSRISLCEMNEVAAFLDTGLTSEVWIQCNSIQMHS